MTTQKDLKNRIRARMAKTGESYTTAREQTLKQRDGNEGVPCDEHVEAIVLKTNQRSARVRILGETGEVTVRSSELAGAVPAQIVSLHLTRRWTWHGDAFASGSVKGARTDIAKLGLVPLPLDGGHEDDPGDLAESYGDHPRLAALWAKNTGRRRPAYELDAIAWEGRRAPDADPDDAPIADAAELWAAGDPLKARELVMAVLGEDLRCIDAHAHLGNWVFDRDPKRALVHYEIGVGIGDVSLATAPADLVLPWGALYNRPFLRALHGMGLALWRLERRAEAAAAFERICALNPIDNQGARFCLLAVEAGQTWEEFSEDGLPSEDQHRSGSTLN